MVYGVISWTLGFILLRKAVFPNRSFEFCNRLISTIHAFLAVTLASISVQNWRCPICPLASKSSSFQVTPLSLFHLLVNNLVWSSSILDLPGKIRNGCSGFEWLKSGLKVIFFKYTLKFKPLKLADLLFEISDIKRIVSC